MTLNPRMLHDARQTLHCMTLDMAGSAFFLDSSGLLCYSILMFHTADVIGTLLEALP
jgi:hypothetical protein